MKGLNGVNDRDDKQGLLREFQTSLGDTVVLLLELKRKPGVTQGDRSEIDSIVAQIQQIIRDLPSMVSDDSAETVFGVIKKIADLWSKFFGG